MIIPTQVKIGIRTVKVEQRDLSGEGIYGYYDSANQLIVIDSNIKEPGVLLETFWHEIIHAVQDYVRFNFELSREIEATENSDATEFNYFDFQETIAEAFSQAILQLFADNSFIPTKVD